VALTEAAVPGCATGMIVDILDRHDPRQVGMFTASAMMLASEKWIQAKWVIFEGSSGGRLVSVRYLRASWPKMSIIEALRQYPL
jgi:hypothetical protein